MKTRFGPVLNYTPVRPASPGSAADQQATRVYDSEQNRLFFEPIFHGEYPADVRARHREITDDFAFVRSGDLEAIHTPIDFLGVNYYTPTYVAAGPAGAPSWRPPPGPTTAMGWSIDPAGLRESLRRVKTEYSGNLPLYVSENGAAFHDYVDPEGKCHDPERVDFLRAHLREARQAIGEGVPLAGYFVWSLLDNFEWTAGTRSGSGWCTSITRRSGGRRRRRSGGIGR